MTCKEDASGTAGTTHTPINWDGVDPVHGTKLMHMKLGGPG
jgi:hypothetical protein